MKVLCAGDHHWDRTSRWDECARVHTAMLDIAREQEIDLFISTGDVYERASTPDERLAVAAWLECMASLCPVLIVRGNHDTHRDLLLLSHLSTEHPIVVEEAAGVHHFGDVAVAAVAWPERARVVALARSLGMAESETLAQDALRNVFRALGAELAAHDGPKLAVGHFMVDGAMVSSGQPLIGQPMSVGLADLALLGSELVVMGHIHKPQAWTHGTSDYVYTGSPYRTAYGETEDKSVVLVDLLGNFAPAYRRISTGCAAMHLFDEEWVNGAWTGALPSVVTGPEMQGAEVRFRYAVEPDQREAARAAASFLRDALLTAGAADVQIEECVRTTTIARAPEVAAAKTLGDKLVAMWTARNVMPEDDRREVLLTLASELEQEQV